MPVPLTRSVDSSDEVKVTSDGRSPVLIVSVYPDEYTSLTVVPTLLPYDAYTVLEGRPSCQPNV